MDERRFRYAAGAVFRRSHPPFNAQSAKRQIKERRGDKNKEDRESLRPDGSIKEEGKRKEGTGRALQGGKRNCVRGILSTGERGSLHWFTDSSHTFCRAEADLCATLVRHSPCECVRPSAATALLCCDVCVCVRVRVTRRLDWCATSWAVCC